MDVSWSYALLGTAVNGAAIVVGGVLGVLLGKHIPERIKQRVLQGVALSVLLIGIKMALETQNLLVVVFSIVIGGIVGELLGIDAWLRRIGEWLELQASQSGAGVANAFVFATLLYGVGSMAVMGALESGLLGRHQILYVKAILDGTTSVALAASMGIGVSLSAVPIVLYQGSIALVAGLLQPFLGANVVGELSGVGGLLILAVGLNMLELQEIKVANFLPAFAVALIWVGILPTLI
ncbi:MAG: putative membrane protein YdfK [Dehalococcoidia bacterium]|nr:putative membrane protein YdfK [Bacillota bacterium]